MNMHETTTQVMLCHRVLRTIQTVATESIVMTRQTWEALLKFLLAVNDTILAPPLEPGQFVNYDLLTRGHSVGEMDIESIDGAFKFVSHVSTTSHQ